ncbi:MAG: peptidoglycan D,D-transpeptidase FtsI family protein, partial [Ktedonobacterales bacterium]
EQATLARARRRQGILFVVLALSLSALIGRAAYWQIGQQTALAARADAEHLRAIELPAGRGEILDSQGRILAVSITERTVIADPDVIRQINALAPTAATLAQVLHQPLDLIRAQLNLPGAYVRLHDASGATLLLSADQAQTVSEDIGAGNLPGVALYPLVQRIYPNAALAAQVLGFVRASDGAGQYGIEQAYQQMLAGRPGAIYTAVDAAGDPIASAPQRQTPAVPGANVTLTLDANVQYWAEQGLAQAVQQNGATGGSVIVLDPRTGAVIAMASLPSFDPSTYGAYPLADFANPAVASIYDPGSVMKAVTMAAGIDTGAITPDSSFYDTGAVTVDGTTLHNWDLIGHGELNMTQVLQYSANVGAVWVAQRVGAQPFDAYLKAFGFGSSAGIGLPGESAGQLANPQSAGDVQLELAENAFGEGIAVTPLQMAAAYGALANGGLLMRPYIVQSVTADGGQGAVTTYGPHP